MSALEELPAQEAEVVRDQRVESLLREWQLEYVFEPEYSFKKMDSLFDKVQVRDVDHRAPRDSVVEYATQMRNGAIFPPVVLTAKGAVIDGNTRCAAAKQIGYETFPAYLVKFPNLALAPMLGAAINQMGGRRLAPEEAFRQAEAMMRTGYSDEAIARTVGRSVSAVRDYRHIKKFDDDAERVGVATIAVPKAAKKILSQIGHDAPFRESVELIATAKPASKDVAELVDKVNEARSEAEELAVVGEYRTRWAPAGPPPQKSTAAASAQATKARGYLEKLLALAAPAAELAPAARREELEPLWRRAHALAGDVLASFDATRADEPATP